jgi:hypothetical protein
MDFDHRPGTVKLFHIGKNTHSEDAVLAEIAKCDVVCANCHRVRTFRTREHAASCTRAVREQRALAATKQLELGEAGKRVVEENRR